MSKFRHVTDMSFSDYIEQQIRENVKKQEIWIPICYLQVHSDFKVGDLIFKPMTKELFSETVRIAKLNNPSQQEHIARSVHKFEKSYLGLAAATISINAETIRAYERWRSKKQKSL